MARSSGSQVDEGGDTGYGAGDRLHMSFLGEQVRPAAELLFGRDTCGLIC